MTSQPMLPSDESPSEGFHGVYRMPDGSKGPGEAGVEPDPMASTFRSKGMRQAWDEARRSGRYGLTVREYRDRYAIHHGIASAHLSNLHEAGYLAKLRQRRDRCGIYVVPSQVGDRPTVPHVKNAPTRQRIVEKEVIREVQVEVPVEREVIREVRVEVPVEVVTVVEREVPVDVTITKAEVTKVVRKWQEDKISGRVFGMDGLADALLALIQSKVKGKA